MCDMKIKAKTYTLMERKLGRERCAGQVNWSKKLIEIDANQCEVERLDTVIHEGLHVCFPELEEAAVIKAANSLRNLLWLDKWRRIRE